jgi:hypothetical protein
MKQYMLSVYPDETTLATPPENMQALYETVEVFNQELRDHGHWVFAGGLHPTETATVVRVKDGDVITTDGPYAEGKEQIGGFWVIKAEDLDAALALAKKATVACAAPVEVRPFEDEPPQA